MTKIEVSGDEVVVHVQGLDKLLAFKSELRIPLSHIEGVARADDELREWKGWRAPGTSMPGLGRHVSSKRRPGILGRLRRRQGDRDLFAQ